MAEYVNIRIRKDTYERLKELSAGVPLVRFLDDACRHWSKNDSSKDEADALLEQLDKKSEEIPMEEINDEEWVMGVAPECCCDFVAHEFNPQYKCEHWHKVKWTDRNGQQKINWHNKLINKFDFANEWKLAMQEYFD